MADTIVRLHDDPMAHQKIREKAYAKSRRMTWPVVGRTYGELFCAVKGGKRILEFPPTPAYPKEDPFFMAS